MTSPFLPLLKQWRGRNELGGREEKEWEVGLVVPKPYPLAVSFRLKVLLYYEVNYKQDEKTAFRMGENNSKWSNWQRINLKDVQTAHAA